MLFDGKYHKQENLEKLQKNKRFSRHRHRLQGRHLLSTSISSTFDDRRRGGNGHSHSSTYGDATNSLINVTNTNNNDILPAVGMYEKISILRKIIFLMFFFFLR